MLYLSDVVWCLAHSCDVSVHFNATCILAHTLPRLDVVDTGYYFLGSIGLRQPFDWFVISEGIRYSLPCRNALPSLL